MSATCHMKFLLYTRVFEIGADTNTRSMGFTAASDPKAKKYTLDMAKALASATACIDIILKPELLVGNKA